MTKKSQLLTTLLLLTLSIGLVGCGQSSSSVTPTDAVKKLVFEKKYPEARAACDKLLSLDPGNYEALMLRGDINQRMAVEAGGGKEQFENAIADYSAAIEKYPTRADAYHLRYRLYSLLSKQETDSTAKRLLDEAAAEDWGKMRVYDPDAVITFKDDKQSMPKSLEKPIPGFELGSDIGVGDENYAADPLSKDRFSEDPFTKDARTEDALAADGQSKEAESDPAVNRDPDDAESTVDAALQTAEQAIAAKKKERERLRKRTFVDVPKEQGAALSDEEAIKNKELGRDELTDFSLPPEQGIALPQKPVTRFDLGSYQPMIPNRQQSFVLPIDPVSEPTQRRGASTGISSQPSQDDAPNQRGRQQYGRAYGLPGVGGTSPLVAQPKTTGIRGGSASMSNPTLQRGGYPAIGPAGNGGGSGWK